MVSTDRHEHAGIPSVAPAILPGPQPSLCPEVLTEEEAIRYLRLDLIDIKEPADTLRRYRAEGKLRGTQIGKCVRYRRVELERFLDHPWVAWRSVVTGTAPVVLGDMYATRRRNGWASPLHARGQRAKIPPFGGRLALVRP
jgi:hypothetical protein